MWAELARQGLTENMDVEVGEHRGGSARACVGNGQGST